MSMEPNSEPNITPTAQQRATTVLASLWGLLSAYQFLASVLITHDVRLYLAAPAPFLAAWAALERRRWARLTLLCLSGATLALFGLAFAAFKFRIGGASFPLPLSDSLLSALAAIGPGAAGGAVKLLVAGASLAWLSSGTARSEFEIAKQKRLDLGQRMIAGFLVALWACALLFGPTSSPALLTRQQGSRTVIAHHVPVQDEPQPPHH